LPIELAVTRQLVTLQTLGEFCKMVKMRKVYSSSRGAANIDASLALEEMELMPEEVAVLKMIHATNYE